MSRIFDLDDGPELLWDDEDGMVSSDETIGFPWHEDLEHLAKSAQEGCPLCGLLQRGVQLWLDRYEEAKATSEFYREFAEYSIRSPIPTGQRLWLTKRSSATDGLALLVRNPKSKSRLYLLTGASFAVATDSPLATQLPLRPIEADSSSEGTLNVAAAWVTDCMREHEQCRDAETTLPTRVLDVGSSGDTVRLINATAGLKGRYASLSHRWGESQPCTTTSKTFSERAVGIRMADLPKTFRDAIVLTRRFGIPYLWIDSLCILQDDRMDWARESVAMTSVYSNASVVIAAGQARDGDEGCFSTRVPPPSVVLPIGEMLAAGGSAGGSSHGDVVAQLVRPGDELPWLHRAFESEPLSRRCWALQERVLARRVVHLNTQQMYFECGRGVVSEDGCRSKTRFCDIAAARKGSDVDEKTLGEMTGMWCSLLWSYGVRELTVTTDRLPAISGLARLLAERYGVQYVAGLWSHELVSWLAWQGLGTRAPASTSHYTGPSWSWSSYGGLPALVNASRDSWRSIATVEDWHVDLKDQENPYGEVNDAWIRLRAPITKLRLSNIKLTDHEVRLERAGHKPFPRMTTQHSSTEEGVTVTIDYWDTTSAEELHSWDTYVLIIGRHVSREGRSARIEGRATESSAPDTDEPQPTDDYYGLITVRTGEGPSSTLKRVGWMHVEGEETMKFLKDEKSWEVVTLI